MRHLAILVPLLALVAGCATTREVARTTTTGADPFFAARRFILEAHGDPRLQEAHRSLVQNGETYLLQIEVPHGAQSDQIEVTFRPGEGGTVIEIQRAHLDSYRRRSSCEELDFLQGVIAEVLVKSDLERVEDIGTMAYSLNQSL